MTFIFAGGWVGRLQMDALHCAGGTDLLRLSTGTLRFYQASLPLNSDSSQFLPGWARSAVILLVFNGFRGFKALRGTTYSRLGTWHRRSPQNSIHGLLIHFTAVSSRDFFCLPLTAYCSLVAWVLQDFCFLPSRCKSTGARRRFLFGLIDNLDGALTTESLAQLTGTQDF